MATRRDVLAYIVSKLPSESVQLMRLTTVTYLCDWRSALTLHRQLTDIVWVNPFVIKAQEIAEFLSGSADFSLQKSDQPFVAFTGDESQLAITDEERGCIDFVLRTDSQKGWPELFRLAYSTYPMFTQSVQATLNLPELADKYHSTQQTVLAG